MTQIKRSRRLQAGLAGLSVFSALGAAVGLGLTTHTTSTATPSTGGGRSTGSADDFAQRSGDDESTHGSGGQSSGQSGQSGQSSPVTPPTPQAPQATTSGS